MVPAICFKGSSYMEFSLFNFVIFVFVVMCPSESPADIYKQLL